MGLGMSFKSFIAGAAVGAAVVATYHGDIKLPNIAVSNPWAAAPLSEEWHDNPEAAFRACFAEATGIRQPLKTEIRRRNGRDVSELTYFGHIDDSSLYNNFWKTASAPASTKTWIYFNVTGDISAIEASTSGDGLSTKIGEMRFHGPMTSWIQNAFLEGTIIGSSADAGVTPPIANRPAIEAAIEQVFACGNNYMRAANSVAPQPN